LKSRKIFRANLSGKDRNFFEGIYRYNAGLQILGMGYLNYYCLPEKELLGINFGFAILGDNIDQEINLLGSGGL